MSHWNEKRKVEIAQATAGANILFVDIHDNNRTPNNLKNKLENCDIVLGYSAHYNLYVAWNAYLHQERNSASAQIKNRLVYHGITSAIGELKDGNAGNEKQVIIEPKFIIQFCNDWLYYMMPTESDKKGFDIKLMWADREHPNPTEIMCFSENELITRDRKKYIHQTYERDRAFRDKVLIDYDYMCAICHCEVQSVLEAHHITYVSQNGSDRLINGICLCRNHHKMVHSKLIKLEPYQSRYEVDKSIEEDILTKWAIETFRYELIVPLSRRK